MLRFGYCLILSIALALPARAQYDFWGVEQILNDSLMLYHGNVAVEVYQHDSLIFGFQSGTITVDSLVGMSSAAKWIADGVMLTRAQEQIEQLLSESAKETTDISPWPPYSEYYPYDTAPIRGAGVWLLAIHPESHKIEEFASPEENGSFLWLDLKRGLRGIFATNAPDRADRILLTNVKLLHAIRDVIDCQAPVDDLTIHFDTNSGVELRWTGHFAGIYAVYSSDNPDRIFPDEWWFEGSVPAAGDIQTVFIDPDLQQQQAYYRIQRTCGQPAWTMSAAR